MTIAEPTALETALDTLKAELANIDRLLDVLQRQRALGKEVASAIEAALSLDAIARGRNLSEY